MATIKDLAEQYGVAKAQDQNENLGRLAEMLGSARDIGNQYKVPSWVPLAGGTGAGDLLMGRTPEEIENWSYGNAPMQIPEMSNVPQFKRGRAQSLADALTTLAPGIKATEGLPAGLSFIGPKSRNWDKVAAELAVKKLDEGADPAEVWREHLIGRMPDKTLFSEISDAEMSHVIPLNKWVNRENGQFMAPNISTAWDEAASTLTPNAPVRIKRLFNHEQLKNEYPYGFTKNYENQSIMDMPVFMTEKNSQSFGSLGDGDLTLHPSLLPKEARSTVLHELQHAIQNQEGWSQGGNLDSAASFYIENYLSPKLKELNNSINEGTKLRGNITNEDEYAANVLRHKQLVAEREKLNDEVSNIENNQAPKLRLYNRLAGEAQARATQDRLDMDMAQRRENYPLAGGKLSDIPLEDLIYKYEGNGPSLSSKYNEMHPDKNYVSWDVTSDPYLNAEGDEVLGNPYALIEKVYTHPDDRNKGVATRLMSDAMREIESKHPNMPIKLSPIPLDKDTDTERLMNFYRKFGFDEMPEGHMQKYAEGGAVDSAISDYKQLLGGYPNATKFVNALQSNIESHIPTTEDLQSPERMGEWSLAAALNQPTGLAIKGYHGSPHKFKEFDTAHMGSGEGGQAYGWGNYITEDPYVATTYSPQDEWMDEQLMNLYNQAERRQDYPSMEVYERYMMHERPNEVKDYLKESYADYPEDLPKRLPAQKIGENLYKKQKGSHLYEVSMEFPREREAVDPMSIEHFLDYDKPLSEQSDYVRNILQSHDPDMYHPEGSDYDPAEKGSSILSRFGSGKEGAQKLYELGIPGTTYMGEKAKVANPEGVRNFVTYSDEVPRVVTRNMNKVKPLTDEDRLNDLEKQMSAYMKTKRMPKGVDFKTGSDWYDWAYDKRAKLRGYAEGGSVDKDSLQLNKPRRTPNHPTKSHIVKTMVDGKEKIIRFGEQGAETAGKPKEGESDRMTAKRESFKARHAKNIAKGPSSAAYWANKVKWAEGGEVDIRDDEGYADDLARLKRAYENSNFGPNDSVIASTIHHPIEAAKRAKDSLMRSIDTASGVPREILDESSAFPFGVAPSMDEQAQAGLDLAGLMQTGAMPFAPESAGGTLGTLHKFRIGGLGYDLRFDDRKLEQDKLQNMVLQLSRPENEKRIISLANYEGYPWVTSMSDRTNVGNLHYINDRPVDVDLQGGQDYMFNNPGQVWASAQAPVNAIMKYGKELSERAGGLDPLYMPWRMAPTGGDYANMTGETMLKYMRSNMNKKEQRAVNKGIKDFIPDFKGIESEEGIDQFRNAPDKVRKALKNHLDTKYRNAGGISIGEARLAVADPSQLLALDTGLQNVGQIYIGNPIIQESGHRAYPRGVPGQGLGVLDRDVMAYDLMPEVAEYRGLIDLKNPRTTDIRALQMKPYGGIITDKILKNLGYAKGGEVKALHDKYEESDYGYGDRPDKTKKGLGYFGELERPDGTGVMTEYSIGVPINGKEMDVPTLVPTLTPDEIRLILHMQDGDDMPRSIVHKAIDHAHQRLSEGKPIFATEEDLYAHGGIVDVLHNDAIEQIMKAFMDSMADDEEPSAPAVSIEITTQNTETPRRGKIPKSIAREAKHG